MVHVSLKSTGENQVEAALGTRGPEMMRRAFLDALRALPDELPYSNSGASRYPDPADSIRSIFFGGAAWPDPDDVRAVGTVDDVAGSFSAASSLLCLSDYVRTKKFAVGVEQTMTSLGWRFPQEEIRGIEAGGGAVPFMSLLAAILEPRARITVLEANPPSVWYAREAVKLLGLQEQVEVICADATRWKPQSQLHFLFSETIDSGLFKEPIADIMANLTPHVRTDGFVVPYEIELEAGVVDQSFLDSMRSGYLLPYGAIITDVPAEIFTYSVQWNTRARLDKIRFPLPGEPGEDDTLVVQGTVQIVCESAGPAIKLGPSESAITMPGFIPAGLGAQRDNKGKWNIAYRPGHASQFML